MKVRAVASIPTRHQIQSFRTLIGGMPYESNPDGSFSFSQDFETKREAEQWLRGRAYMISYDGKELKDMLAEINKYATLTADTLTIRIEAIK